MSSKNIDYVLVDKLVLEWRSILENQLRVEMWREYYKNKKKLDFDFEALKNKYKFEKVEDDFLFNQILELVDSIIEGVGQRYYRFGVDFKEDLKNELFKSLVLFDLDYDDGKEYSGGKIRFTYWFNTFAMNYGRIIVGVIYSKFEGGYEYKDEDGKKKRGRGLKASFNSNEVSNVSKSLEMIDEMVLEYKHQEQLLRQLQIHFDISDRGISILRDVVFNGMK